MVCTPFPCSSYSNMQSPHSHIHKIIGSDETKKSQHQLISGREDATVLIFEIYSSLPV